MTICLIGKTTYTSKWVDWEIRTSSSEGNRRIGVRLHGSAQADVIPTALTELKATILNWDVEAIVKAIG